MSILPPNDPASACAPALVYKPPQAPVSFLYIDEALLIVDKPAGLLSVPGRGADKADCLVSRVAGRFPEARIVHRLDLATSGLMVLARGAAMHRSLSRLFEMRQVHKRYEALVAGLLEPVEGRVELPLITDWPRRPRQMVDFERGKPSLTLYRRTAYDAACDVSRVALEPHTGRSHQLRVHLAALGHPILGDELYAFPAAFAASARLALHATELAFVHPGSGEALRWRSAAPF